MQRDVKWSVWHYRNVRSHVTSAKLAKTILGKVWRDKIRNEDVRRRTGMKKLEDIIRKRRLQWIGCVHRMKQNRIPRQVIKGTSIDEKKKRG